MCDKFTLLLLGCAALACGHDPVGAAGECDRAATLVEIPPTAGLAASPCDDGEAYFAMTSLADREEWYGKHLRALGEHPLCDSAGVPAEVYRLTWLPSFHPTVVVRIERTLSAYILIAKAESGAGGYEPGHLARDTTYTLGEGERAEFVSLLSAADFWTVPTTPPPDRLGGFDGAQWVLEGLGRGRYHVVDRWSPPTNGPDARYRQLAAWMLQRSGLAAPDLVRAY